MADGVLVPPHRRRQNRFARHVVDHRPTLELLGAQPFEQSANDAGDFTTESIRLRDVFQALGMEVPFNPDQADFYGMCMNPPNDERLFIDNIIHKAMMAVDEKGVEAAAATAVIMAFGTSVPPPPTLMVVDKPFVVAIVDEPTGSVLFLGRITDPTDEGSK